MLYVVATPIGNLKDITLRAIETLRTCDFLVAENPGYSKRLINHLEITNKPIVQFAEHNEQKILPQLIVQLESQDGCLVTDAGTPGISDPGFRLVRECIRQGIKVIPIPGPNAAITALSTSGLPINKFLFLGFLGKTEYKVLQALGEIKNADATGVFYESPERILKTIGYIAKSSPNVQIAIARELTKVHEEFIRGTAKEVLEILSKRDKIKGEITVLLSFK